VAFNALCGNGDDHPRNHGVLCTGGRGSLSPAYDIAPYITFGGSLALSITRDGHLQAARWALLRDCETFGFDYEEGEHFIDGAIGTMMHTWEAERPRWASNPRTLQRRHPISGSKRRRRRTWHPGVDRARGVAEAVPFRRFADDASFDAFEKPPTE
jgi:hypothetical protein